MTARRIVGLKADYGSLDDSIQERTTFIEDAQRVLSEVGEVLRASGAISDGYSVRHFTRGIGYAGEVVAIYAEPGRRFAVSLVFAHAQDEVKTRPDGVAGYAHYRRMKVNAQGSGDELLVDPIVRPEDRLPLKGTYPDALIHQVRVMLADHPMNPEAPRKKLAAG